MTIDLNREYAVAVRPNSEKAPELPALPAGDGWKWLSNGGDNQSPWYRIVQKVGIVWKADAYRFLDLAGNVLDSKDVIQRDPSGSISLGCFKEDGATYNL